MYGIFSPLLFADNKKVSATNLTLNLVAYWKNEEATSATRVDATGRGNDLTNVNSVTQQTGIIGNASGFVSASSQSLTLLDNTDLSMGDIDFEIAGWIWFDSVTGVRGLITKWDNSTTLEEYALYYNVTASRFNWLVCDASNTTHQVDSDTFGAASISTWYFVDIYHDSVNNLIGISINNGAFDTTAHTTGVRDGTRTFRVGVDQGTSYHSGRIDELGVWKRLLTSAERTALYNGGAGKQPL